MHEAERTGNQGPRATELLWKREGACEEVRGLAVNDIHDYNDLRVAVL